MRSSGETSTQAKLRVATAGTGVGDYRRGLRVQVDPFAISAQLMSECRDATQAPLGIPDMPMRVRFETSSSYYYNYKTRSNPWLKESDVDPAFDPSLDSWPRIDIRQGV